MNRTLSTLICALSCVSPALCQRIDGSVPLVRFAWPQHVVGVDNYVVYKERAFAVGAPVLVSGPTASDCAWSSDGQFLIFREARAESNLTAIQNATLDDKPMNPDTFVDVYSLNNSRATDVLRLDPNDKDIEIQWIAGSDKALVVVNHVAQPDSSKDGSGSAKLFIIDAAAGSAKEFDPWESTQGAPQSIDLAVSPTQSFAFVEAIYDQPEQRPGTAAPSGPIRKLVLMTADEQHAQVSLPDGFANPIAMWSEDGEKAYVVATNPSHAPGLKSGWFTVSLANGSLSKSERPRSVYTGAQKSGLITVRETRQSSTNEKVTASINNLWLETMDPDSTNRMLLAGDATEGTVSSNLQAASYIAQGSLFVRPITEIPRARYNEMVAEWNRFNALYKAHEAGLGLIMYADDYDGALPPNRGNWTEMIAPYLKDGAYLDGFVYSYPGGPIGDIHDPSKTQLGYVDYGDGRAVVYVDGHVTWIQGK